jgi:DNA repair protein RecO (recombination protein O)
MVHTTRGIVLRTVKYGDTSIITTVYTALFGVQSYIVKGVRKSSKTSSGKASYFQPAALLEMEVHQNNMKHLQFIREYQWSYLYERVLFDVVRNTVASYIVELLQHALKEPEANPELFYLTEDALKALDKGSDAFTANLPLYFTLQLASELGFQLLGAYSEATAFFDLQEGMFIKDAPTHPYYLEGELAKITSQILHCNELAELEHLSLNRTIRRALLAAYQNFMSLHIQDFGEIKSLAIIQEVLG